MNPVARALRRRLFNVVPAASFQMEKLLGLVDIVSSDAVPSAAVECSYAPRLLLNPEFVERHCRRDGHLLMLVMHELQHVILGHTRLFPRVTPAHNVAFDAVINAMLCKQFPSEADFFRALNRWEDFPGRLLRPAPGWPHSPQPLPADASDAERKVHALLYSGESAQTTYHELFELLLAQLQDGSTGPSAAAPVLLGDHAGHGGQGEVDEQASRDPMLQEVLRRIVEGWPPPDRRLSGRDLGRETADWGLAFSSSPRSSLRAALRRLLSRAGVIDGGARARRRPTTVSATLSVTTVLPQGRDRRAHAWRLLHGAPPLLWRGRSSSRRRLRAPQPVAHVYLDVSGSMRHALPVLAAALRGLHETGAIKLFVFSTVVDETRPGDLARQRFRNTQGTDIRCVLDHLEAQPARLRPRRVVLITDGYVGQVRADQLERLRVALYVGHYAPYGADSVSDLSQVARHVEPLPDLAGAQPR